jgi:hypothetical protein
MGMKWECVYFEFFVFFESIRFLKTEFIFTEMKKKSTLSIKIIFMLIIVLVKFDKVTNYIYNYSTLMN